MLTRKRVEKARELLLGTSLKVKEISELCGYSDQQYFSYSFKKVHRVFAEQLQETK